jgi:hypothetical protein
MDWDKFRRDDGSIDLYAAWNARFGSKSPFDSEELIILKNSFAEIEDMQKIISRQAAAIAIVQIESSMATAQSFMAIMRILKGND